MTSRAFGPGTMPQGDAGEEESVPSELPLNEVRIGSNNIYAETGVSCVLEAGVDVAMRSCIAYICAHDSRR